MPSFKNYLSPNTKTPSLHAALKAAVDTHVANADTAMKSIAAAHQVAAAHAATIRSSAQDTMSNIKSILAAHATQQAEEEKRRRLQAIAARQAAPRPSAPTPRQAPAPAVHVHVNVAAPAQQPLPEMHPQPVPRQLTPHVS